MKRYFLFCLDTFYPAGGMKDFVGDFDTVEEAQAASHSEHQEILDTETRMVMVGLLPDKKWTEWISLYDHSREFTRETPCNRRTH